MTDALSPIVLAAGACDADTKLGFGLHDIDPLMTVIISTPIQIFIAWRIKIISRASWLALIICFLAIVSLGKFHGAKYMKLRLITILGGGIWLTVTVIHIRRYARKPELHWPALTWLLASAIADVTITISLAFNLVRMFGFSWWNF